MRRKADYTLMRCLYCGKELALLKRLTGGGEFCSDAHKQSYQEEYNRLALSRLLQAQKKPDKTEKAGTAEKAEKSAKSNKEQAPARPAPAPEMPRAELEPPAPPPAPPAAAEPVTEAMPAGQPAAHPLDQVESAGFLVESPGVLPVADAARSNGVTAQAALYLEPSSGDPPAPALVASAADPVVYDLSTAKLAALPALTAWASPAEATVRDAPLLPKEFETRQPASSVPLNVVNYRRLPSAGTTPVEISLRRPQFNADNGLAQPVDFHMVIQLENWPGWELPVTGADFPAEDADVVVGPWSGDGDRELWMIPVENAEVPLEEFSTEPDATPRAALEALSRLHQDLSHSEILEPETMRAEAVGGETMAAQTATLVAEPSEAARPEEPQEVLETEAPVVSAASPAPGQVTSLTEVAVKTFGPAKPSPVSGEPLLIQPAAALLPRLDTLPLRPKVALAPEYAPPLADVKPAAEPQVKPAPAAPRVPAPAQPKPVAAKPSPVPLKGVKPKPATTAAKASAPLRAAEPAQQPPASVKAEIPVPASKTSAPHTAAPPAATKTVEATLTKTQAPAHAEPPEKPAAKTPAAPATPLPPQADSNPKAPAPQNDDLLPSFGSVQPSPSFLGSLKLKLGIGIVLIAGACTAYFGWGTKPHRLAPVSDGAGPSIIIGEGGWVEGWGGDPSNVHAGREITLYRPSLKLADYRIEFQGRIETKSLGWVFRAADPQNYYAMKLTLVSSGLTPRVELFKYLVVNGRQTQVGRVPIDLPVHPDTNFNVRVDARGPQFTTYLQGQQVDVWTDDQLKTGGVGLLNEREERGQVKSVSIRILNEAGK